MSRSPNGQASRRPAASAGFRQPILSLHKIEQILCKHSPLFRLECFWLLLLFWLSLLLFVFCLFVFVFHFGETKRTAYQKKNENKKKSSTLQSCLCSTASRRPKRVNCVSATKSFQAATATVMPEYSSSDSMVSLCEVCRPVCSLTAIRTSTKSAPCIRNASKTCNVMSMMLMWMMCVGVHVHKSRWRI